MSDETQPEHLVVLQSDHPLVAEAEAILTQERFRTLFKPEPDVYKEGEEPDMRLAIVHNPSVGDGAIDVALVDGKLFLTWNTKENPALMSIGKAAALVGKVVRWVMDNRKTTRLVLRLPSGINGTAVHRGLQVATQNGGLCKTEVDRYLRPKEIRLIGETTANDESLGLGFGRAMNFAAWLTALPNTVLNPVTYAALIETLVRSRIDSGHNPEVQFLRPTPEQFARMGLLQAVAAGSEVPGQVTAFVVHPSSGPTDAIVRVTGKGVCMDTGGLDVKIDKGMQLMHQDMRGSAVVNAVGLLAMTYPEILRHTTVFSAGYVYNSIGPKAYMTEGVYPAYNGKQARIKNTDAEGRLVLADVAAWLREIFGQSGRPIDVATLTGHAHIIGGDSASIGLVGDNNWDIRRFIEERGEEIGDPFDTLRYRLEHGDGMKDSTADIANLAKVPPRHVGCQSACHFVREFAGEKLIHLDIAKGCTDDGDASVGRTKGLSNDAGFAMLVELLGQGFLAA